MMLKIIGGLVIFFIIMTVVLIEFSLLVCGKSENLEGDADDQHAYHRNAGQERPERDWVL
jgi:hypothetical protein